MQYASTSYGEEAFEQLLQHERRAAQFINYEEQLVPGRLQIAEYTRAISRYVVFPDGQPQPADEDMIAMQERRHAKRPGLSELAMTVLLHEAVLCRNIGGPEVMLEQLRYLLKLASTVEIYVIPFKMWAYPAPMGSFVLLDANYLYRELPLGGEQFIQDPHIVAGYVRGLKRMLEAAFDRDASKALIEEYIRTLET